MGGKADSFYEERCIIGESCVTYSNQYTFERGAVAIKIESSGTDCIEKMADFLGIPLPPNFNN
ncbi:hypothetical protein HY450_02380 [Candidatus Pacearchaeota archaeon]|nr:hypothetical protein [Candidatus Pacearchaeota archaeon]